ncbi:MAG: hypothetical protein J5I62_01310, partial [Flavobacteriales bacterium]|nr:hypothetical protein [Flavobacteriales bacterium]
MKKGSSLLYAAVLISTLALPRMAQAQTWHSIGSGTNLNTGTQYPSPFADYFAGLRMQSIYLASELSAAGLQAGDEISTIRWEVTALQGVDTLNDFTVRLAHTTLSTLSGFQVFPGGGVATTPIDYKPVLGMNEFKFRSNFTWDG